MFLAALNFVNRFYFCVYGATALFAFTRGRKLRTNYSTFWLAVLSLAMLMFNPDSQDTVLDMIKPFTFLLCFILGSSLYQHDQALPRPLHEEEKRFSYIVYMMAGGSFLHFLMNMVTNWNETQRAVLSDFWTKSEMSATAQAALALPATAAACAFLFAKTGKLKKIIGIAVLALIVTYNLILAGRTLFVMLLITIGVALLYICFTKKQFVKPIVITALVAVVLFSLYNSNTFGLKTKFENSNFYYRFYGGTYAQDMEEDARTEHKKAYLERFFDHPWGGSHINEEYGHHAHDLYLDTYDESSIFALVAVGLYILASLGRLLRCLQSKKLGDETKLLILCTYLICNIEFWMEPIMSGIPWLFAAYCFVDGGVCHLLAREKSA